ncbi:MAG TPA: ribosomal protein S18-alanine N-acetyltransferase [Pyrinomonadaceae bacterium]|jgi:ribosomal-protein-alanine N-acetyltransferase|nr:ribosomal protein S18-alanine N-acetyltransferase [Pyrinomonadaceae bacterium]
MAEQRLAPDTQHVSIELMCEHDLLEVVEIEERAGLSRWGWAAYYAELQGANRDLMLVARPLMSPTTESVPIAGYIVARETAGELHINNFAVRPEFRRRGIGATLLNRVLDEARRRQANAAFLEVRSTNHVAQALYEKCGFRAIARRANYYIEPVEDAVVMSMELG